MSVFGIHAALIAGNEARARGTPIAPADRQIARTKVFFNDRGQVSKILKFAATTVISQKEFFYDDTGRLIETFDSITCTKKVIVYGADGRIEDTITYRVADR